jgi:hypothetical protein
MILAITGCSAATEPATGTPSTAAAVTAPASAAVAIPGPASAAVATVRFTAGDTTVDVTIDGDSPAVREFLQMLPLRLPFEEFAGREKVGYLPRKLDTSDSPGSDPEDGDLIYFAPWGNLGFYYNAAGIGHDDDVIHLGRYTATEQQLRGLENGEVTIAVVD